MMVEYNGHLMLTPHIFQPRKSEDYIADNIRVVQNIFTMLTVSPEEWPKWSSANMLFYDTVRDFIFGKDFTPSTNNKDFKLVTTIDGITSYTEYIASELWESKRNERIAIDGYKCSKCGVEKPLEVHHLTYNNLGSESMEDLVTLCAHCHYLKHKEAHND